MTNKNLPSHRIYAPIRDDRGKETGQLVEIGAIWPHKKGEGMSIKINALPLETADFGNLVAFVNKQSKASSDRGGE